MRRGQRIAVVLAFVVCGAFAVMGLAALGTATEGPLSSA